MTIETLSHPTLHARATVVQRAWPKKPRRCLTATWKYLAGVMGCLSLPLSIVVNGWSYRLARRSALKTWFKRSPHDRACPPFRAAIRKIDGLREWERTPHWFIHPKFAELRGGAAWRPGRWLRCLLGGLWKNLAIGFKAFANTLVVLILPVSLMMMSWYSGWDNSFNKGYEQFNIGMALGWSGIVLFMAAMFYLPIAQARFAVTGEARAFYHFKMIRRVIRRRWLDCLVLAAGYSLLSLPLMVTGSFLALATSGGTPDKPNPLSNLTPAEAVAFLHQYYFFCCLFVFPAFVVLRCWAAQIYARGMYQCVETGCVSQEKLSAWECQAFKALRLGESPSQPERRVSRLAGHGGRCLAGFAAAFLWFTVIAQTYVTQFFAFQPVAARFGNHALIQLPWYHYVPAPLR